MGGIFVIAILLPIPVWKYAVELWVPFMFTALGRAAYFIIMGPMLVHAESLGVVFGIISILNGFSYFFVYFFSRKSKRKKAFFRPFDPDTIESTLNNNNTSTND
eukprot:TRINITY_DN3937_c0_g1_i2.p1 TRINITY_DN3937_c0_g1~~TRINITY_DN3937_c0_g1_i2.p1  ORF type:complete len:104 (-),score=15.29 TRINITY_DN3937_c0_g1_i2:200-511(-)